MYRIELAPGEVTVFRTIEELATGVRNGFVTSKARIHHSASEKWLPIEFHPHYKRALELASKPASEPSVPKPAERRTATLSFLNVPLTSNAPAPAAAAPVATPPASPAAAAPAPVAPAAVARAHVAPAPASPAPVVSSLQMDTLFEAAPVKLEAIEPEPMKPEPIKPEPIKRASVKAAPMEPEPAAAPMAPAAVAPTLEIRDEIEDEPVADAPAERSLPWASPLPPVSASPVLELPRISYPEITPLEEPVAERASGVSRRRRPLQLAGAVLVLAIGGYASTTFLSFGRGAQPFVAATTMAEQPVPVASRAPAASRAPSPSLAPSPSRAPAVSRPPAAPAPAPAPLRAATPAPKPAAAPVKAVGSTADAPLPPASSGFAPALESRAIVSTPMKPSSGPNEPAGDSTAIAPPPIDVHVAAPALPRSLVAPRANDDSAMKKILRAVSGGKDAPPRR